MFLNPDDDLGYLTSGMFFYRSALKTAKMFSLPLWNETLLSVAEPGIDLW